MDDRATMLGRGRTIVFTRTKRTAAEVARDLAERGFDVARMLVGSEGTLGVVVEVTLRLVPQLAPPLTAVATFPSETVAAGVVAEAMVALVLAEACVEKFGGDSVAETARNHRAYLDSIPELMRTWQG